jgi:hypothetical protein
MRELWVLSVDPHELIGFIEGGLKERVGEEHDKHLYER